MQRMGFAPTMQASRRTKTERSPVSKSTVNIRLASAPLKAKAIRVVFEIASSTRGGGRTVGHLRSIELRRSGKERIETILAVSLGKKSRLTPETLRRACGPVVRFLRKHPVARAEIDLTAVPGFSPSASVTAVCEGLILGAFQFRRHKSPPKDSRPSTVYLLVDRRTKSLASAVERALSIAEATNLAREWSHEPPNLASSSCNRSWCNVRHRIREHGPRRSAGGGKL